MLAKGADLGVELGIEPVGLLHRGAEVIQDQPPWRSAEMAEGILEAAEEVVGGLAVDDLAVGLAGVGQHDAEDMGLAALAVGADDRGARAEVDLGLVAGPALEAAEGKLARRLQAADEAADAVVAAGEAVFGGQILVDALGAEAQVALGLDHLSPGLALAGATVVALLNTVRGRTEGPDTGVWRRLEDVAEPGGALAGFGADSSCRRAGGRIGWFWRRLAGVSSRRAHWLVLAPPLACLR